MLRRNHGRCFPILAIIAIFIAGCQSPGTAGGDAREKSIPKKVIKLSHSHQADFTSELQLAAWIFQQWIHDHSDDLEVKIYAANALGQEREVYEGMQLGSGASCVVSGTAILNNFTPRIGVLDLPFLWRDYDHVYKVLDGEVGDTLAWELEQAGFKVLGWLNSWGYRNVVTSNKEIKTAQDLKGLKIRTIQTPVYLAALNAMGVNATPMAFGEVYTGMQTGVLDGFEHNATVIWANKFYEVGNYITLTRHLLGPVVFIFSKKAWDRLSDNDKEVIQEAVTMARDVERGLTSIREREAFRKLQEHGVIINEIDTRSFAERAVELQNNLAEEMGALDLLERIRAAGQD
ncbi:MAG: TRAP transporter substrate-binding protein [Fidelibacterota bacterium]|nr:MAG: TRAP transporter substrate-binding protein [Candidatus Neomarinimicrobiota bacterium]